MNILITEEENLDWLFDIRKQWAITEIATILDVSIVRARQLMKEYSHAIEIVTDVYRKD